MDKTTKEKIKTFFYRNYIALTVGVFLVILGPILVFSTTTYKDDTESDFNSGTYDGTTYNTNSSTLEISTSTNIWSLPNNQNNGWVDMSNNQLLLHLDEDTSDSSTTFTDDSGQGNDGSCPTDSECPSVVNDGKMHGAMKFDGSDDYVSISEPSTGTGSYTISVWVKPNKLSNNNSTYGAGVLRSTTGENQGDYMLSIDNNGAIRFYNWRSSGDDSDGQHKTSDGIINTSKWHHIVAVWNGNKNKVYLNGVNKSFNDKSTATGWGTGHEIGRNFTSFGYYFNGKIDETAIFDKALSTSTIREIYNRQKLEKSGSYKSEIFDNGDKTNWKTLSWTPNFPYLKELPDNQAKETAYETGNIDMSSNVALWHMNSSTAVDSSGNGNDGTLKNGVTTGTPGRFGNAMGFDGSDDYVSISEPSTGTGSYTISVWVKPNKLSNNDSTYGAGVLRSTTGDSIGDYMLNIDDDGAVRFYNWRSSGDDSDGQHKTSDGIINTSKWHHIVAVWNGNKNKVYLNGVNKSFNDKSTATGWETGHEIGRGFTNSEYYFNGKIDETAIFDKALSTSTIKDIYQRGAKRLKFQVRSCDDSACSGETFTGSDGTNSSYYTASTPSSSPSTTPSISLTSTPDNKYFQYKAVFEADVTTSPKLATTTIDGEIVNDPPTTTIDAAPAQLDQDSVSTTLTITDAQSHSSTLQIDYSLDNNSWNSSTISSVSQNGEGDGVNTSTGKISDIDTDNDGTVNMNFHWDIGVDLGEVETSSAYLRFDPSDPYETGIINKTSNFSVDTAAPSQPGKLSVNSLTSSSIKFGFPANTSSDSNFDQYKIYLASSSPANANNFDKKYTSSTDANMNDSNFSGANTTNKISGLNPNQKYYFQLFAYDTFSNSTSSLEASTTTDAVVPSRLTTSTITTSSIEVSWNKNSNPSGTEYELKNVTDNTTVTTTDTSTTESSLDPNKQYEFKVRAINGDDKTTSYTNKISEYTHAKVPSAPTLSNSTSTSIDVSIAENGNPAHTKYAIYNETEDYYLAADGTDNDATPVYQTTSTWGGQTAKNLSINKQYEFTTKAKNQSGVTTNKSTTSSAKYTLAVVPTNLTTSSVSNSSIDLSWQENSNPSGTEYELKNVTDAATVTTTNTSTTESGLSPNKNYEFKVRAINGDDKTTNYTTKISEYTHANQPNKPTASSITTSSVSFDWSNNGNPDGTVYELNNTTDNTTSTTTNTSTQSSQLKIDSKYKFKLRAKNGDDKYTGYTNTNTIYTKSSQPTAIASSTVTTSSIKLTWSANGNPSYTTYKVKNITSSTTKTTSTTSTSFDGLSFNSGYDFRLKSINQNNIATELTNTATIYTHTTVPTKPTKKSASQNSLTLSWTGNGSTYNLKTTDNAIDISDLVKSEKQVTGLTCGTNYKFHVRAFNTSGVATNFSKKNSFSTKSCPETSSSGGGGGGSFSTTDSQTEQEYQKQKEKIKPLDLRIVNVGKHKATIEFDTNKVTSAKLIYRKDEKYNLQTSQESSFTKQHKFHLENLGSNAQFDFKIKLKNSNQTKFTFGPYEFTTQPEITTPPNVVDFSAQVKQQVVKLSWTNPDIEKFDSVQINRSTSSYPSSPQEGKEIFTGQAEQYTDQTVASGQTYFYTIFVKNTQDIYSSGVLQPVIMPEKKEKDEDTKQEDRQPQQKPAATTTQPQPELDDEDIEEPQKREERRKETTSTQQTETSTTQKDQQEKTKTSTKKQEETTTTKKEDKEEKQQDDNLLEQAREQLEDIKDILGLEGKDKKEKEKIKQKEQEPTKQEKLEPIPDEQAFDTTKPTKEPPTPRGVKQLEESAVDSNKIDLFSLVKQTAQASAQALGTKAQEVSDSAKKQVSQGYQAAKKGATEVYKLSKSTQKELSKISNDLIDQAGNLSLKAYKQLSKQEQKQVKQKLDKPLPPEFDSSTVADIKPLNVKSKKAKKAGADWHVFSSSNALLSMPESAFDKPVSDIIVSFTDQAYVLKHKEDTNTYEAIVKAPKQKGKYEMNIQIIYQDNTYEQLKRSVLVDPYGYVYTDKFRDFSWSKPWQIFTTKREKIKNAVVTLYTKNKTNEWVKWPADLYNQENPQTTKENGRFAFVTPEGSYYLEVKHEDFPTTETDVFEVKDKVVNINIELGGVDHWEKFALGILVVVLFGVGVVVYFRHDGKFDF